MRAAAAIICLLSFSAVLVAQDTTQAPQTTQTAAPAQGGTIHGVVRSGNSPLPGATVTATNTLTGDKATTYTDIDGSFTLQVPANGRYVVRSEMPAFAASTQEALINATNHDANVTLEPILASRAAQAAEAQKKQTAAIGKGFQTLSILQSAAAAEPGSGDVVPSGMPVPGFASGATESVSISGNNSSPFSSMSSDEMRARFNENRDQGGAFGGSGFGGGFGGGRGGPPRGMFGKGFNFNIPHGSLYYSIGDAALNASPYSLNGQKNSKAGYEQNRFGVVLGGPFMIPKLYKGSDKTFFFFNYNGSRGQNPFDQFSTVPTLLERAGDFSQTTYTSGADAGQPVQLFGPGTTSDKVTQINPVAVGLLNYIPLPNLPGSVQNFHYVTSATNNSDDFNIRLIRALGGTSAGPQARGPRNSINFGFHYHGSSSDITNPFPSVGGKTADRDFDIPVGYVRTFGKLTNNFRIDFNRSRSQTANLYQSKDNIAGELGITGVSQNPFDWGLPSLSFNDFSGLQDTTPELLRDQTWSFSDGLVWTHKKHTWRWGGDFRRLQVNSEISTNARGSFTFSGCATQEPATPGTNACETGDGLTGTGYDFADFLLGQAQQTSVQYGINNYHFRGNSWDLYLQDEYKLRGNLTLNLGVRYEYVSPYTEINNRIANLDLLPASLYDPNAPLEAARVLPGGTSPYNGRFPDSLVRPDHNNFAPRLGVAWKPLSKTVVRAGFGINYNTTQYETIAQELAFQPPFAIAATNSQATYGAPLTLQNGFPQPQSGVITNSYAVNPNYRLGYVQIRNLDVQQEILPTLIVNLDYTGTKGTDLDILQDPNRVLSTNENPTGIRNPNVQAFNYENSVGNLSANAGSLRVRKRLQAGVSIGGTYTFSKSIDDASTIGAGQGASTSAGLGAGGTGPGGGGGGSSSSASTGNTQVAQNPFNLSGERGLSSFNQTHKWTADYLLELPFGHDKRFLSTNTPWRAVFGDWQWSGDWTIASGLPFTPHILGSFNEVNSATNGTLRPDLTGEPIALSNGSINEWFNTAAFTTPPSNSYGTARRNSIIGPGTRVFDMAWTKLFPLRESRVLEFRAQATNVFNTPQYASIDTSYTSPTFGRVISVGAMRAITMSARFRF